MKRYKKLLAWVGLAAIAVVGIASVTPTEGIYWTQGASNTTTQVVKDSSTVAFGTSSDIAISWDGTDLDVNPAAANNVWNFGIDGRGMDVQFLGATDANALIWDASAAQLKTSGTVTLDFTSTLFLANDEEIANATDAVITFTANDDAVELLDVQLLNDAGGTADNDYIRQSVWIQENDDDTQKEMFYIDVVATDVTSTTEDARIDIGVMTAGTLADELVLTGAALYPNADGGLDIGLSGTQFGAGYFTGTVTMDGWQVGSGTTLSQSYRTSATITAGATSATLTLPVTYTPATDELRWSIVPAAASAGYAGHGDDHLKWEGGTLADAVISSATFVNLAVHVAIERR